MTASFFVFCFPNAKEACGGSVPSGGHCCGPLTLLWTLHCSEREEGSVNRPSRRGQSRAMWFSAGLVMCHPVHFVSNDGAAQSVLFFFQFKTVSQIYVYVASSWRTCCCRSSSQTRDCFLSLWCHGKCQSREINQHRCDDWFEDLGMERSFWELGVEAKLI